MSTKRFDGQVAVVTGAARGIGKGIAERLGSEGASVVILDVMDGTKTVEELKSKGIKASYKKLNVTKDEEVKSVFEEVVKENKKVDILVQAAGITGKTGIKTHEVDSKNFDLVMSINLKGIFLCCKAVLPGMVKQGFGRIVNIASISGKEGNAGMLAYSTSKAAVIGLTKVIGKEYAETGVTCNCIAPAVVRTEMVSALPEKQVKYMTDKIPMKRCGSIEEIAAMVGFIASKESSFITAFCFDSTGGRATY
ncbi:hypothetical protein AAMO2058_001516700 [Amorphochlora amoebiformis]